MRPFEFVLILETGILLILIFFNKKVLGKVLIAVNLLITFAFHYFLEGLRWQLYPVYAIILFILLFYNSRRFSNIKWPGKLTLIFCLLLTIATGIAAKMIPVFDLPQTTSKYAIGTQNFLFKDAQRDNRALKVKFWFPTSSNSNPDGVYSENPSESLDGLMGTPGFVFGHLKLVKTSTINKAEVLKTSKKLPLVIYSHGAASMNLDNTALLQEIAGNGFVVMAIDYNFSFDAYGLSKAKAMTLDFNTQKTFITDLVEKVVPNQVEDILFTLRKIGIENFSFSDNIDFDNIVLIGHSLGGTTAIDASLYIQGVQAVINMDGPINSQNMDALAVPLLYMSSYSPDLPRKTLEKKGLPDIELYQKVKNWELENVYRLNNRAQPGFHWMRLKNAGHLDFTDIPFILPIMTTAGYDKHNGHLLKTDIIMNFLDFHLKHESQFRQLKDDAVEWIR